ncbi:hypothetical protein GF337_00325 [candidate division KSB1 bacterium]|nr:hypothetical protein [candidate division KSB1 bacterium]
MNKSMTSKSYLVALSIIVIMVIGFSCADIPSQAPPLPEFMSKVRFIHTATDLGEVGVVMDGTTKATLSFGQASAYFDEAAGRKLVRLDGGAANDTAMVRLDTDDVIAVYVVTRPDAEAPRFVKKAERRLYRDVTPADTLAKVLFAQMCDATLAISVESISGADTTTTEVSSGLAFTNFAWGSFATNGPSHTLIVKDGDAVVKSMALDLTGGKVYTEVLHNTVDNLSVAQLENN